MLRALCLVGGMLLAATCWAEDSDTTVYELRTYVCNSGKLDDLHARFRDYTLRLFEKHGMTNVAYWTPVNGEAAETTLIYLLKHKSREAANASWAAFRSDPAWKRVAMASEMNGKILATPPESTFMTATDYSKSIAPPAADGVYELRIYTTPDDKLEALHARFRDHTDKLFHRHGMESYGYWRPLDLPAGHNTLVYVLHHDSVDGAQAAFQKFVADPDWQAAKTESEKEGRLVIPPIESVFMTLTDYSPRQK